MNKTILATGLLAAALIGVAGEAAAQSAPPKKIQFLTNYVFHGRHSPFFVGLEKGIYREAGFDIQIAPATGSGFVISALEGNKADYGMADAGTLVQSIAKGAKSKGFSVFMDVSPNGVVALKPFPEPQSLKGATMAASVNDSARVTLPIIFGMRGIDPSILKWESADPSAYVALLLGNRVDVLTATIDGDVPAWSKTAAAQGKQLHFTSFASWGYDVFGFLLVARAERLQQDPNEAKAFAAATAKAVQWALANPDETARIMVKHNPTLNVDTTLAQWSQSMKAIDTPYVKQHGYGAATPERIQRTIDLVKQATKLEANLKPDDVFVQGMSAAK